MNRLFAALLIFFLTLMLWLQTANFTQAANFTVTTTADSGAGSLRQAILDANANPGLDTISFAIGPAGSQQTITPTTNLPTISDPVMVDGWSQGGAAYTGSPLIELNGVHLNNSSAPGLRIDSGGSTVRGLAINRFDAPSGAGLWLRIGDGNWIYGNYIGVGIDGSTALPNHYGIWIDNWGSTQPSDNNIIGSNGDGVNDAFEGNVIAANISEEIRVETAGNTIAANYIGTNAAGSAALNSSGSGIILFDDNNIVGTNGDGTADSLEGNLISGNNTGIVISNSSGHLIAGNIIGLDASGGAILGNGDDGISCNASAALSTQIIIGSNNDGISDDLEGNIIAGNNFYGFSTFYNNCRHITISGNVIGADGSGLIPLGNGTDGIIISQGDYYTITHNLIADNGDDGINLGSSANHVTISDNIIGADAAGTADLGNGGYGIRGQFSNDTIITGNQISGNDSGGLLSQSSDNVLIADNLIGVQVDGSSSLGNESFGVYIFGSSFNAVTNNVIAYSQQDGIAVSANDALSNTISSNAIFSNGELGIDLALDGVTPIDADDVDSGPNGLQNPPTLLNVTNTVDDTILDGELDSTPNRSFTLEFFSSAACDPSGSGEGQLYLGSDVVTTDANGDAFYTTILQVQVPQGQFLTVTATGQEGTSEFSTCFGPTGPVQDSPITGLTATSVGRHLDYTPLRLEASVSGGSNISYIWDPGDGTGIRSGRVITHTYNSPAVFTAVVTATNNASQATASTVVTITRSAVVYGSIWDDWDGDGQLGPGETYFNGETIWAKQNGRIYSDTTGTAGSYIIKGLDAGAYTLTGPALAGYRPIGNNIRVLTVAAAGDAYGQDFTYQEDFTGVQGRAWLDSNFNGRFELSETILTAHPITLTQVNSGAVLNAITDLNGYFRFDLNAGEGSWHILEGETPPLHEESSSTLHYANLNGYIANLAYRPGAVGGCVTSPAGSAIISGLAVRLYTASGQQLAMTTTAGDGCYFFTGSQAQNAASVRLTPAAGDLIVGPASQPAVFQGAPVRADWEVAAPGEVWIILNAVNGAGYAQVNTAVQGYQVHLETGSGLLTATTNLAGAAYFDNVVPGLITATIPVTGSNTGVWPANWVYTLPPGGSIIGGGFSLNSAGISAECRTPPVPNQETLGRSFSCTVDLYAADDTLVVSQALSQGEYFFYEAAPAGSYRLELTPNVSSSAALKANDIFYLPEGSSHHFQYPYYLPEQIGPISGRIWYDNNLNGLEDPGEGDGSGFTVELLSSDDTVIESAQSSSGRYDLYPPTSGSYNVRFVPGPAFVATTPAYVPVTYDLSQGISREVNFGAAYRNTGVAGQIAFNDIWNSLASNVTVQLLDPDNTTSPLTTTVTGPAGQFDFTPIATGSYLLRVLPPGSGAPVARTVYVSEGSTLNQDILLPADGIQPTLIVYVDNNDNGRADLGEGLAGLDVLFEQASCGQGTPAATRTTNSDGVIATDIFFPDGGCARIDSALPEGLSAVQPAGVELAPYDGGIVHLRIGQTGYKTIKPIWDLNGDGWAGFDEPLLLDYVEITFAEPGYTAVQTEYGFEISGPVDSVIDITIVPPPGGQVMRSQPFEIYLSADQSSSALGVPIQFAGGISGALIGPTTDAVSGRTVELVTDAGAVIASTTTGTAVVIPPEGRGGYEPPPGLLNGPDSAPFNFSNIPPGNYWLHLADPPVDLLYHGDVPIIHDPANPTNATLRLSGGSMLSGLLYWDSDYDGRRNGDESGTDLFEVVLVNDAGLPPKNVTPAADGTFVFTGLQSGVQYALTVPELLNGSGDSISTWITDSPGWFTLGSQTAAEIGIGSYGSNNPSSVALGRVFIQNGSMQNSVAGASIGYYQQQSGSGLCSAANPTILGQTVTAANGRYRLPLTFIPGGNVRYCLVVLDAPGLVQISQSVLAEAAIAVTLPTGEVTYEQAVNVSKNIEMAAAGSNFGDNATITWAAFRDENLNGFWDAGEFPLPGVVISGALTTSTSSIDGSGRLTVPAAVSGEQKLTIIPPTGYRPVKGPERAVWLTGSNLNLPPIGFAPAGFVSGQLFVDKDGDGWPGSGGDIFGPGNVPVTLSGPVVTTTVSQVNGRFLLAGLADGVYTVSVDLPGGMTAGALPTVTVDSGYGLVRISLQSTDHLSGILYQDWDGDGLRLADESVASSVGITVTAAGIGDTLPMGGEVLFWDVGPGMYVVDPLWSAAASASVVLDGSSGGSFSLPAVPGGLIRGTLWFDANRDGLRQPWEPPLSGITVELNGGAAVATDEDGQYIFGNLVPGSYTLTAQLPDGLEAAIPAATVANGRGVAVGIAAQRESEPASDYQIYLPFVANGLP